MKVFGAKQSFGWFVNPSFLSLWSSHLFETVVFLEANFWVAEITNLPLRETVKFRFKQVSRFNFLLCEKAEIYETFKPWTWA